MSLSKEEIARYSRHLLLNEIGVSGQEKLKQAKVLVIGAGGLGCPALLYLAGAGVGTIGIVDFDKVDESNLQRQILYGVSSVGKLKAEEAKRHLSKQNPYINIISHPVRLTNETALNLFPDYDIIIDGTDNFATRYLVNDACVLLDKPLVYGSIYKFEGQVSVFNYSDAENIKGPSYRCLFPTPPSPESSPNCSEIGVLGVLPGIIGTLQANETIKLITGIGKILSGKLLLFDALNMQFTSLSVKRNEEFIKSTPSSKELFLKTDYNYFCDSKKATAIKEITVMELHQLIKINSDIQMLDVREVSEQPQVEILKDIQIPLGQITDCADKIDKNKQVIVFCRSGARSAKAIQVLKEKFGFENLYNLKGGVMEWMKFYEEQ